MTTEKDRVRKVRSWKAWLTLVDGKVFSINTYNKPYKRNPWETIEVTITERRRKV